jgi:hypothetical protein
MMTWDSVISIIDRLYKNIYRLKKKKEYVFLLLFVKTIKATSKKILLNALIFVERTQAIVQIFITVKYHNLISLSTHSHTYAHSKWFQQIYAILNVSQMKSLSKIEL